MIKKINVILILLMFCCCAVTVIGGEAELDTTDVKSSDEGHSLRFAENGVAIDFFARYLDDIDEKVVESSPSKVVDTGIDLATLKVGKEVVISFKVSGVFTKAPVKGLLPDSFVQYKKVKDTPEAIKASMSRCRFRAFKRGKMYSHPPLLENTYAISLNSLDNSLSVINPLLKPKTIVKRILLGEKCNDLNIMEYGTDLYISCDSGKVLILDCQRLKIVKKLTVGKEPFHIEFQPDGKYVWVCNDGDGTVTVIDTEKREVVKSVKVGKGHHEIAFDDKSRFAYVTNHDDDSLSVIDILGLNVAHTVKVGKHPHGLAYSRLSQSVYVANEGSATLTVFDTVFFKVMKSINVGKGVRKVAFDSGGRFCFALNKKENSVSVIDTSKDTVLKTIPTGLRPESIVVSDTHAYVRNTGSPDVTAIKLKGFERVEEEIPIGLSPPNSVRVKEDHFDIGLSYMVLIPDPVDNIVYTIMDGAIDTAFKYMLEGKGPSKVAFFWIGLKESSPGVYSRVVKFDKPGRHELGFYIGNPEIAACFEVNVVE